MKMYLVHKKHFLKFFCNARLTDPRVYKATSSTNEVDQATNVHDRFMITADGRSGFIVKQDGELIAVFSTVKGRGDDLIQIAKQCGAEYLDCFEGFLTDFYKRHGFGSYKIEPNWIPGEPAVHYMKLA